MNIKLCSHFTAYVIENTFTYLSSQDVGRFPAYKELYAEYTWSNGPVRAGMFLNVKEI